MFFIDSTNTPRNYFWGIAYSKNDIVLSLDGMRNYVGSQKNLLDLEGGRYSLIHYNEQEDLTLILTDPTGQDILYYYQDIGYWAISNSLYLLVEKIKKKKINLTVYWPALCGFKIQHSLGRRPLNNNTVIKGIKILPRNKYIKIKGNNLSIHNRIYDFPKLTSQQEYQDELSEIIHHQVDVLNCLVNKLPQGHVRCDLSGGMDSRVAFGMCTNINNYLGKIKIASNKKWENDYLIAQKLMEHYGGVINNSPLGDYDRTIDACIQFKIYLYGNSGVYSNIYKPNSYIVPRTLHIHGAGGESLRGFYVGSPRQIIGRLKSHFKIGKEYDLVREEFFSYFYENQLDINDPASMFSHVRSFSSRFHFGRNWFRFLSNPLYTPLSDIRLERLSDYLRSQGRNPAMIFYDIYLLLDKYLAFFPFDELEKNMNSDKLKYLMSLNSIAKKISDSSLNVYGEFTRVKLDNSFINYNESTLFGNSFEELVEIERTKFLKNYPYLSEYSQQIYMYSILNLLNLN